MDLATRSAERPLLWGASGMVSVLSLTDDDRFVDIICSVEECRSAHVFVYSAALRQYRRPQTRFISPGSTPRHDRTSPTASRRCAEDHCTDCLLKLFTLFVIQGHESSSGDCEAFVTPVHQFRDVRASGAHAIRRPIGSLVVGRARRLRTSFTSVARDSRLVNESVSPCS